MSETAQQRRARWKSEEQMSRSTKGHVFAICQNCGEAWMASGAPARCRRCESGNLTLTRPCPGCEECATATKEAPSPHADSERCCPGHGTMAHVRGCRNHPEGGDR